MKKKYCVIASILLILGGVYIFSRNSPEPVSNEKIILTEHQLEPYLNLRGWKVSEISAKETRIPESFEGRYLEFADIMSRNGFDLASHKGETVMRYTYSIENHSDDDVIAELLVTSENELISACIIQQKPDGFIEGI
ncbi:MAG: DUF4830 domain-containing protein [Oscillospiraceae bacterium]|nr:DUF4830 domain-containing protein [Oscillospiraceae bacterium]